MHISCYYRHGNILNVTCINIRFPTDMVPIVIMFISLQEVIYFRYFYLMQSYGSIHVCFDNKKVKYPNIEVQLRQS